MAFQSHFHEVQVLDYIELLLFGSDFEPFSLRIKRFLRAQSFEFVLDDVFSNEKSVHARAVGTNQIVTLLLTEFGESAKRCTMVPAASMLLES